MKTQTSSRFNNWGESGTWFGLWTPFSHGTLRPPLPPPSTTADEPATKTAVLCTGLFRFWCYQHSRQKLMLHLSNFVYSMSSVLYLCFVCLPLIGGTLQLFWLSGCCDWARPWQDSSFTIVQSVIATDKRSHHWLLPHLGVRSFTQLHNPELGRTPTWKTLLSKLSKMPEFLKFSGAKKKLPDETLDLDLWAEQLRLVSLLRFWIQSSWGFRSCTCFWRFSSFGVV